MNDRDPIGRFAIVLNLRISWFYGIAVVLTAFEVIMRYGFNAPTIWVHDAVIALCAICFVLGGAYALAHDQHIRITSVFDSLPARVRDAVSAFNALCTLAFLLALGYAAIFQAQRSIELMETSGRAWDVPIPALLKTVLALGVILMAVLAVDRLIRAVRAVLRGAP